MADQAVTAESFAEEQIRKHGIPTSLEKYRAILELVFSMGAIHGALNAQTRLTKAFQEHAARTQA